MDAEVALNCLRRTEQKLLYATFYIEEITGLTGPLGQPLQRAHMESYFFHLLGALDSFLGELNFYYDCGLSDCNLSVGNIRENLKSRGLPYGEVSEIYLLQHDPHSWLSSAKRLRDHCTHISGISMAMNWGGDHDGELHIIDPRSKDAIKKPLVSAVTDFHMAMVDFIDRLRSTASFKLVKSPI